MRGITYISITFCPDAVICPVSSSALSAGVDVAPLAMNVSYALKNRQEHGYKGRRFDDIGIVETLVCGSSHRRTKIKTRFKNGKKLRVIHKLDEEQMRWILAQKRRNILSDAEIARSVEISARWIRKLWSWYGHLSPGDITYSPKKWRHTCKILSGTTYQIAHYKP